MTADELLQQLQDIRPPPEPAWWQLPPALVGIVALIIALIAIFVWLRRRHLDNRLYEQARQELDRIAARVDAGGDDSELVLKLAEWLKRVAIAAFPERQPAALVGQRWLEFLDQSGGERRFSDGVGQVFAGDVYRLRVPVEVTELLPLCESWLRAIAPCLRQRGRQSC